MKQIVGKCIRKNTEDEFL